MSPSESAQVPLRAEMMDAASLPLPATEKALADLDRLNRSLFGYAAGYRAIMPRVAAGPGSQILIDLGTGSGILAEQIRRAARRRGVTLRVIGVDRKLSHLLYGRRQGTEQARVAADATALPFRDAAADWSFSNLFFHHFTFEDNQKILGEMRRVARRGAVVTDLRRAWCARILIRLLLPLFRAGEVASYDGKLSTDQAWCLERVRQATGSMPRLELRRRFPFRFSLVLRGSEPD